MTRSKKRAQADATDSGAPVPKRRKHNSPNTKDTASKKRISTVPETCRLTRSKRRKLARESKPSRCFSHALYIFAERERSDLTTEYLVRWDSRSPRQYSWEVFEDLPITLFANWIMDRTELEDTSRIIDHEEDRLMLLQPDYGIDVCKNNSGCVPNELEYWSRGGEI